MKYSWLLFDVDNTLLDFDRSEHEAMTETLIFFGFPATDKVISTYSEINASHWKLLEKGEMDRETVMWHRFLELGQKFGFQGLNPQAFAAKYLERLSTKSYVIAGAFEVCSKLAERYPLYAITNGNTTIQKSRFDPSPIAPLFRQRFISEEIGYDKPSIEYFRAICREIPGLIPERTLVIGDSLSSDITGGIRWGTDTCYYSPRGKKDTGGIHPTYTIERLDELLDILQ